MALLIFTPLLSIANFGFGIGFQYGYKWFSDIWIITIIFISAQLLSTLGIATFVFNQSIQRGPIAGFLISILGLLVANLWK